MDKNNFLIDLSESELTDFDRLPFEQQSVPQKVFSAIWQLESQVNNGGFDQYFVNCDYDVIAFAATALKSIGALACAEIVESAIELISPLPATQAGRYDALAALGDKEQDKLEVADSTFFAYPDNLTELLFAYVAKHPEEFGPVPVYLPLDH